MSSLYHLRDLLISTSMGLNTVLFISLGPSKIFYNYYFIQQGHIILIKSSSKDVHNITKDFCFKESYITENNQFPQIY